MALHAFCKNQKTFSKEDARTKRKKKCYDSIRRKINLRSNVQDSEEEGEFDAKDNKAIKMSGNKNAAKHTRAIEYGWFHNDTNVRKATGGGNRKSDVAKSITKDALLEEAKRLYSLMESQGLVLPLQIVVNLKFWISATVQSQRSRQWEKC
jgi:hypothetical protein